jgi:hypothetical protein
VRTAQVVQPVLLGSPPVAHPGVGALSGVSPFILAPAIAPSSSPGGYGVRVLDAYGSPPGRALAVDTIPAVRTGQRALLLLSQTAPPATRLVDGGVLAADANTLIFPLPALAAGQYFVQILVDGAQSALAVNAGGAPVGPVITL